MQLYALLYSLYPHKFPKKTGSCCATTLLWLWSTRIPTVATGIPVIIQEERKPHAQDDSQDARDGCVPYLAFNSWYWYCDSSAAIQISNDINVG